MGRGIDRKLRPETTAGERHLAFPRDPIKEHDQPAQFSGAAVVLAGRADFTLVPP